MKKIYSKFVKERKKQFQIETAIYINETEKVVVKKPLYNEGLSHIKNIIKTYEMFENQDILCKAWLQDNNVFFEYLSGKTYEEYFIEALLTEEREKIHNCVDTYLKMLDKMLLEENREPLSNSKDFMLVFGEVNEQEEVAYKRLIFDLTFDNIICLEDMNMKIIDYEWCFDFSVSVEFIKFRAVWAFWMKNSNILSTKYSINDIFELFGVNNSNVNSFLKQNDKFIDYVYGEEGYNKILDKYKKINLDLIDEKVIDYVYEFAVNKLKISKQQMQSREILDILENNLENNKDLFNDYKKFFVVTNKIKENNGGYIFSNDFSFEFDTFIKSLFEMINYYKNESEQKEKIILSINNDLYKKSEENKNIEKKLEYNEKKLEYNEKKLDYIESFNLYKYLLKNKVDKKNE